MGLPPTSDEERIEKTNQPCPLGRCACDGHAELFHPSPPRDRPWSNRCRFYTTLIRRLVARIEAAVEVFPGRT